MSFHTNYDDELFFIYLNGTCVGLTTRSVDRRVQRQIVIETIAKSMGFDTVKEYFTSLPGYNGKERLRYVKVNDRWSGCTVEKSRMKRQLFTMSFERPDCGDGRTIKDGMLTRLNVFYSHGNGIMLLAFPNVDNLKKLKSFRTSKLKHTDFYICLDWK